jgi:hypothetical protein
MNQQTLQLSFTMIWITRLMHGSSDSKPMLPVRRFCDGCRQLKKCLCGCLQEPTPVGDCVHHLAMPIAHRVGSHNKTESPTGVGLVQR